MTNGRGQNENLIFGPKAYFVNVFRDLMSLARHGMTYKPNTLNLVIRN